MTNREKINNLSNEELALLMAEGEGMCQYCVYRGKDCWSTSCDVGILKWLESEADNGK